MELKLSKQYPNIIKSLIDGSLRLLVLKFKSLLNLYRSNTTKFAKYSKLGIIKLMNPPRLCASAYPQIVGVFFWLWRVNN
jgi:hypothetical protein